MLLGNGGPGGFGGPGPGGPGGFGGPGPGGPGGFGGPGDGNSAIAQWVTVHGTQVDYGGSASLYDVAG